MEIEKGLVGYRPTKPFWFEVMLFLSVKDIKLADSIIEENEDLIVKRWEEYFKK